MNNVHIVAAGSGALTSLANFLMLLAMPPLLVSEEIISYFFKGQ